MLYSAIVYVNKYIWYGSKRSLHVKAASWDQGDDIAFEEELAYFDRRKTRRETLIGQLSIPFKDLI